VAFMEVSVFERYEIRLSGSGGQGLVLAGVILSEAAAIYDDYYAVQTQSYGPEARGGASKAEVIIGTEPISYPKATKPNLLLALNQLSFDKYARDTAEGGIIIVEADSVNVDLKGDYQLVSIPIIELARKKIGREVVVNMISLGIIQEFTSIVAYESLEKAVLRRVPKGTEDINSKALKVGKQAAKEYKTR